MLACGVLHIHIVDEGEVIDSTLYPELIEDKFEEWCGPCDYLVCDFEKSLCSEEALLALEKMSLKLVDNYPRWSQDFDAIENAQAILKERLDQTMPQHLEGREAFVVRLKAAVRWANTNRADQLWFLCNNQKERARDCLKQKPPGGCTQW